MIQYVSGLFIPKIDPTDVDLKSALLDEICVIINHYRRKINGVYDDCLRFG